MARIVRDLQGFAIVADEKARHDSNSVLLTGATMDSKLWRGWGIVGWLVCSPVAWGASTVINNEAFTSVQQQLDNRLNTTDYHNTHFLEIKSEYLSFLSKNLKATYQQVLAQLSPAQQTLLATSQKQWRTYQKSEFTFIEQQWQEQDIGPVARLYRAQYKIAILKQRIVQLYDYGAAITATDKTTLPVTDQQ